MGTSNEITSTLRAQDHGHPPVICLEGNGIRPSHRGGGYSEEGKMFTLNTIERHAVCFPVISLQANMIDRDAGMNGCGWNEGGAAYTVNTIDHHAVCYAVDSHPADSRFRLEGGGSTDIDGESC